MTRSDPAAQSEWTDDQAHCVACIRSDLATLTADVRRLAEAVARSALPAEPKRHLTNSLDFVARWLSTATDQAAPHAERADRQLASKEVQR
jgi:hypothetical protein